MTHDEHTEEGAPEAIEDLEAPAEAQEGVAGGACPNPTCGTPSMICAAPTCKATAGLCLPGRDTHAIIDYEQ